MDQETLSAVKQEMAKVTIGMMDAMSLLAVLIYASGSISKTDLVEIAGKAAADPNINPYGSQMLRGMCTRLESWEGDLPQSSAKKH